MYTYIHLKVFTNPDGLARFIARFKNIICRSLDRDLCKHIRHSVSLLYIARAGVFGKVAQVSNVEFRNKKTALKIKIVRYIVSDRR